MKKVVRGLAYHHGLFIALPEECVEVETLKCVVPPGLLEEIPYYHRESDVFGYRPYFFGSDDPELAAFHSSWLLYFYETRVFICWIAKDAASTRVRRTGQ